MNTDILRESIEIVQNELGCVAPAAGLVLGSGWGAAVETMRVRTEIPFSQLPCLGAPQVEGHRGRLLLADCNGTDVLVFQGRRHWYEGVGWEPIAFPVHVFGALGARRILLTNAAGGIREDLQPGGFMVIDDHINAMGVNPLTGPHDPAWGPRFPDQSEVYSTALRDALAAAAASLGEDLAHGTYLAASGPTYETPAEVRAYSTMGADAVGMSTVPEAILANAAGFEVAAVSCITNRAAGVGASALSHEEVVAVTRDCAPRMQTLVTGFVAALA